MTAKTHTYEPRLMDRQSGSGTSAYRAYSRNHEISAVGKPIVPLFDPAFNGDPGCQLEDLLVASLSGCHMLWYLHLCAVNKVVV